jgi:autotransporter-associated beta strand protein
MDTHIGSRLVKRNPSILMVSCLALTAITATGQTLYWDSNDVTPGAGTTPTGTWGTSNFWSTDPLGTATTEAWTSGGTAVFSAGTDATGPFTVTVSGTQTASGITVEEGTVTLTGGTLNLNSSSVLNVGTSTLTVASLVSGGSAATRFLKEGAGTVVLGNAGNTFTGGLIIKWFLTTVNRPGRRGQPRPAVLFQRL